MPTITISKEFESSPEIAFDVVSDFPNAANYIDAIIKVEMLTDGPVAVGTSVRETRMMMGREASEEMTVTIMDKPTLFVVEAYSRGTQYVTSYTISPSQTGALVTLVFKSTPTTFMSKVFAALFSKMLSTVADLMEKDLVQAGLEAKRRANAST